ncbi:MAG: substrate-binding domain-containing protein [Spirochaetales bacterium]|nr:substrate-binding domain-containing protein [Spirochaetales bacterium]
MATRKRQVIACITAFIDSTISQERFFGVVDCARDEDANLFVFITRFLNDSNGFDRQSNILLDFIDEQQFDGIIIGNIVREDLTSEEESQKLFQRYSAPRVSIRENTGGIPYIGLDNYGGIAAMVRHLISVHHAQRFVYVRGPHLHPYAELRYKAFRETIRAEGLSIDESLVTPPGSWWDSKFSVILDERKFLPGRDFDAVVCSNDILAAEVMRMLQAKGYSIPRDVLVTGFNNTVDSSVSTPTLSSIEIPFYTQGYEACKLLFSIINSPEKSAGDSIPLAEAKLVFRDSCGCIDPAFSGVEIVLGAQGKSESVDIHDQIMKSFQSVFRNERIEKKDLAALTERFIAFCIHNGEQDDYFSVFQHILNSRVIGGGSVANWSDLCTQLRNAIVPVLQAKNEIVKAETLFHKMRMYIFSTSMRLEKSFSLKQEKLYDTIRKLGVAMISTFDIAEIMNELAGGLSKLKIDTCYVSLYDNPDSPAELSRLILAVCGGERAVLEEDGILFPSCEIIPKDFRPRKEPYSIIVMALFFRNRQIGFICYRLSRDDTVIYEMIKEQLNTALQIALSIHDLEKAQKELSAQTDELARSNSELEQFAYVASHDLQEPLRKIIAMSDRIMTMRERSGDADITDYLERMHRAGYRMHTLIEDLLAYSRVSRKPRPFEKVNLKEVCEQVVVDLDMRIRQTNAKINIGELPVLDAEPVQMRQLFQNIIGNAMKFHREGIDPVISIDSLKNGKGMTEIQISDNGIGIKHEFLTRIFGIFERLHTLAEYEGSGIGLAICKKIAEHHKGSIVVESTEGKGTTFIISLPFSQK